MDVCSADGPARGVPEIPAVKQVTFDDGTSATLTTLASSTNTSTFYATGEGAPLGDAEAAHQDHLFRIRKDGYTILRSVWDEVTCARARARLDELHRELTPDAAPGSAFQASALYNKGEVFEGVYQDVRLLRIVRHFLGDDATIMSLGDTAIHGVVTPFRPGPQPDVITGLHNDGSLTGAFQGVGTPADDSRRIVSHVLYLQAIWCLSPFSKERGGTSFVPGSHLVADLPVPPAPVPGQTNVEAAAGDVFLYNTALWHTAGANTSQHSRYAILSGWTRSWLWRGWTKPMPRPEVLARAGEGGEAIFGLKQMERIQFDTEAKSPVAAARELLDRVVRTDLLLHVNAMLHFFLILWRCAPGWGCWGGAASAGGGASAALMGRASSDVQCCCQHAEPNLSSSGTTQSFEKCNHTLFRAVLSHMAEDAVIAM
jgi:ectoine hydroxylase-related dioxygenase (phytanoyl-CoA dioxygenase family)